MRPMYDAKAGLVLNCTAPASERDRSLCLFYLDHSDRCSAIYRIYLDSSDLDCVPEVSHTVPSLCPAPSWCMLNCRLADWLAVN
jgi:hypothetical protein